MQSFIQLFREEVTGGFCCRVVVLSLRLAVTISLLGME